MNPEDLWCLRPGDEICVSAAEKVRYADAAQQQGLTITWQKTKNYYTGKRA